MGPYERKLDTFLDAWEDRLTPDFVTFAKSLQARAVRDAFLAAAAEPPHVLVHSDAKVCGTLLALSAVVLPCNSHACNARGVRSGCCCLQHKNVMLETVTGKLSVRRYSTAFADTMRRCACAGGKTTWIDWGTITRGGLLAAGADLSLLAACLPAGLRKEEVLEGFVKEWLACFNAAAAHNKDAAVIEYDCMHTQTSLQTHKRAAF